MSDERIRLATWDELEAVGSKNPPPPSNDGMVLALNRIADEIGRLADATYMLARATAGEFDEGEEVEPATDLTGRPLR